MWRRARFEQRPHGTLRRVGRPALVEALVRGVSSNDQLLMTFKPHTSYFEMEPNVLLGRWCVLHVPALVPACRTLDNS